MLVVVCLLLIIWISLSGASPDSTRHPPCYFNPLCSCSKTVPDLGIVRCVQVPLPRIPLPLNNSKLFRLHLEENGLRNIEPFFLQSTGNLFKFSITLFLLHFFCKKIINQNKCKKKSLCHICTVTITVEYLIIDCQKYTNERH